MDFIELINELKIMSRHVLSRSPLCSTHWNIEQDCFVNMGSGNAPGYVALNFLRELDSQRRIEEIDIARLVEILNQAPAPALFFSLHNGKYITEDRGQFYEIHDRGSLKIYEPNQLKKLVLLEHIKKRVSLATKNKGDVLAT